MKIKKIQNRVEPSLNIHQYARIVLFQSLIVLLLMDFSSQSGDSVKIKFREFGTSAQLVIPPPFKKYRLLIKQGIRISDYKINKQDLTALDTLSFEIIFSQFIVSTSYKICLMLEKNYHLSKSINSSFCLKQSEYSDSLKSKLLILIIKPDFQISS